METIYAKDKALIEKYAEVLGEMSMLNPKENGEHYDLGVCFDMLKANAKADKAGEPLPYKMAENFDFEAFREEI